MSSLFGAFSLPPGLFDAVLGSGPDALTREDLADALAAVVAATKRREAQDRFVAAVQRPQRAFLAVLRARAQRGAPRCVRTPLRGAQVPSVEGDPEF